MSEQPNNLDECCASSWIKMEQTCCWYAYKLLYWLYDWLICMTSVISVFCSRFQNLFMVNVLTLWSFFSNLFTASWLFFFRLFRIRQYESFRNSGIGIKNRGIRKLMIEMSYSVGRKWVEVGARLEEQDQKMKWGGRKNPENKIAPNERALLATIPILHTYLYL